MKWRDEFSWIFMPRKCLDWRLSIQFQLCSVWGHEWYPGVQELWGWTTIPGGIWYGGVSLVRVQDWRGGSVPIHVPWESLTSFYKVENKGWLRNIEVVNGTQPNTTYGDVKSSNFVYQCTRCNAFYTAETIQMFSKHMFNLQLGPRDTHVKFHQIYFRNYSIHIIHKLQDTTPNHIYPIWNFILTKPPIHRISWHQYQLILFFPIPQLHTLLFSTSCQHHPHESHWDVGSLAFISAISVAIMK